MKKLMEMAHSDFSQMHKIGNNAIIVNFVFLYNVEWLPCKHHTISRTEKWSFSKEL